jgi:hypothetical protein
MQEETEGWRKLHKKQLHDLYFLPNIIWVIKSSKIKWAGQVAYMGHKRNACRILVWNLEAKKLLERSRWSGRKTINPFVPTLLYMTFVQMLKPNVGSLEQFSFTHQQKNFLIKFERV